MAFSWNTPVSGGARFSATLDETIAELKNNIDHVYTQQGHPAWTWTEIPVGEGTYMESVDIVDLRAATDHIHGNNSCVSDCVGHYIIYDSVRYDSHNPTKYFTHDGSHLHGVLTTQFSTHDGTHHLTYCSVYQPGALTAHKDPVYSIHNSTYNSGIQTGHLTTRNITHLAAHDGTHCPNYNGAYDAGVNLSINSTYYQGGSV